MILPATKGQQMDMQYTNAILKHMAHGIVVLCRDEYPDQADEAISDMCEAVICAQGLKGHDADKLREFCGL